MSLGRWIGALAAVVILGVAATLALVSWNERIDALEDAERDTRNLARTIASHALRAFSEAEWVLEDALEEIAARGSDHEAMHAFLKRRIANSPELVNTVVTDRTGRVIYDSRSSRPLPLDLSDRHGFLVQSDDRRTAPLVGIPTMSPDLTRWLIPVSRRIEGPEGEFAGIVVAVIDPRSIQAFYDDLDIGPGGSVSLFLRGGRLLVGRPRDERIVGRSFADTPLFAERLAQAGSGTFRDAALADGAPRLVSYRAVARLPLVVAVAVAEDDVLGRWQRNLIGYLCAGAAVALTILVLAGLLTRELRRREADRARLVAAERDYHTIFDNAADGIYRSTPDGRQLRANPALVALNGYSTEAELLFAVEDISAEWYVHPNRRQEFIDRLEAEGEVRNFISEVRRHGTGEHLWVLENAHVVRDENGNTLFYEGSVRDITQLKRTEAALVAAKEAAEAASRAKTDFLANMSHELRTPLNAIMGFSEMMRMGVLGPLPVRYSEYARDIHDSACHLLQVINDILDLAKVEAGQMTIEPEAVETDALFASCVRLMRERAATAGLQLTAEVARGTPLLWGDETRLKQILLNLLSNAVKFTPSGGRVVLGARREGAGVLLSVEDTGIGMSEDEVALALQPFRQVESAMTRSHEGTGLGVPLTKALVERHGGRFRIGSVKGEGTTVELWIPAAAERALAVAV